MLARSIVRWPILFGFLALVLVTLGDPVPAAAGACTCQNIPEIKHRKKEIQAAIEGYEKEINRIGQGPMFSIWDYRAFQNKTQQATLDRLRATDPSGGVRTIGNHVGTDPSDCGSHFTEGISACMRESAEVHERHHSSICQGRKSVASMVTWSDYRNGHPLADAYQEEIEAYTIERAFLDQELGQLPDTCTLGWKVEYTVQVRGEGGKVRGVSEYGGEQNASQMTWKVDHSYSGTYELRQSVPLVKNMTSLKSMSQQQIMSMTPQQLQNLAKVMTGAQGGKTWTSAGGSLFVPITVSVDDKIVTFGRSEGEAHSYIEGTTTKIWKGNGQDNVTNGCTFDEDPVNHTYNVTIKVQPLGQSGSYTVSGSAETNKSEYGFGSGPTHDSRPLPSETATFDKLIIPTVQGLFENATVRHAVDRPLDFAIGSIQFDSGWIQAKPLTDPFKSWPQADKNLKVHVYYRITKIQ